VTNEYVHVFQSTWVQLTLF